MDQNNFQHNEEAKKHISRKGSMKIANCPSCRGVLFKDFNIEVAVGEVSFIMRCPHCQKNIVVTINHDINLRIPD